MKKIIFLSILVFSSIGSGIGNIFDHQSPFNIFYMGGWSILIGTIGAFFGIWAGYKAGQYLEL